MVVDVAYLVAADAAPAHKALAVAAMATTDSTRTTPAPKR